MAKGISGCSTLTKLSLRCLRPQCSSASVQAAMALQSSLTEVEWSYCDLCGKSDIGVTVLVCDVWCVVRYKGKRGWEMCIHICISLSWCAWGLHCVCPSLVNVAVVVWWETEGGEREFVCVCNWMHLCAWVHVCVFEMHLHCVCPSLVNVATSLCGCIGVWVVRVLECMFIYSRYPSPSIWQTMVHFWRTLLSIWNTADCGKWNLFVVPPPLLM